MQIAAESVETEKIHDILGTDDFIITDLKPEITSKEVDDLSYLGVAPEAKRTVAVFTTSSLLYHIAISVVLLIYKHLYGNLVI